MRRANLTVKLILFLTLAAVVPVACTGSVPAETVNVALRTSETYRHLLPSGDEQGSTILVQAEHFEVSDILPRTAASNYAPTYVYTPAAGFMGSDRVVIEILSYNGGVSELPRREKLTIRFTVQ